MFVVGDGWFWLVVVGYGIFLHVGWLLAFMVDYVFGCGWLLFVVNYCGWLWLIVVDYVSLRLIIIAYNLLLAITVDYIDVGRLWSVVVDYDRSW